MLSEPITWPPPFTLRRSSRARRIRLQICAHKGLQIIVPVRFNANKTTLILQTHRRWIERTWQRLQPCAQPELITVWPESLILTALKHHWQITYQDSANNKLSLQQLAEYKLQINGIIPHAASFKALLKPWLHNQAKQHLLPWLAQLSERTGLNYTQARIRHASTLWGSCSAHKNISLNYKLLFLAPELVEHVLLHELCHTVHLNHSPQFWQLFQQVNPNCLELRRQLKEAHRYLPAWLEQ